MADFFLSNKSLEKLSTVHKDLRYVVSMAITHTTVDFTVIEGLRSLEKQKKLLLEGASQTLNSRHITGHAVDLGAWVNGVISWDWCYYKHIASAMKFAAKQLNIPIEWGGDWESFKDGVHFQLPFKDYP